ncbi:MAG: carotenoid biosynthesis protein [Chitinophagales bacterium]|nr:carotenoid biosynthesis protein [Chitinophagales bacterium]
MKIFFERWSAVIAIVFLAGNHLIGAVGINSEQRLLFEKVSWINLLLSLLVVIAFQKPLNRNVLFFAAFAFALGMLVEILGVNTGFPFGIYYYTEKFGAQLFGVPLIIGANWVLLSYCCGMLVQPHFGNDVVKIVAASALMLVLDLLLEPFAIRHSFWVWESGTPPMQNFLSWFVVSLPIQWVFCKQMKASTNKISIVYLFVLVAFLIADLLASK